MRNTPLACALIGPLSQWASGKRAESWTPGAPRRYISLPPAFTLNGQLLDYAARWWNNVRYVRELSYLSSRITDRQPTMTISSTNSSGSVDIETNGSVDLNDRSPLLTANNHHHADVTGSISPTAAAADVLQVFIPKAIFSLIGGRHFLNSL